MAEWTQTATITKTAERCKAEGIGLSYHQLWSLCKQGRLKNIPMGRSRLIYWPNLIAFLESGGESGDNMPGSAPSGGISPIPENFPMERGRRDENI